MKGFEPLEAADTRTKLLDVAERLFAQKGISATSLRTIIGEAGVNIASIHYHFGSKEALVREVFARRLDPVNQERLQRLDDLQAASKPPTLEGIIETFIGPVLRMKLVHPKKHETILKLFGQLMTDSEEIRGLVSHQFEEVAGRFIAALGEALPHLSKSDVVWRFRFMIGTVQTIMMHAPTPKALREHMDEPPDIKGVLRKMIPFLVAGFTAPATETVVGRT